METTTNIQGGSRTGLFQQVAAVGVGAAVASVGAFIGVMGALSCMVGCEGLTPGILVAYGGLAIMAASPFAIARVSKRERWLAWGALGLATGTAAFFLARGVTAMAGSDNPGWAVILPSFGLAAVVTLPARDGWVVAARVVGVLAFSMIPAVIHDAGVFIRFVVHSYPDGSRMSGWEDHGGSLIPLALLGVPAGLFLPNAIHRRTHPPKGQVGKMRTTILLLSVVVLVLGLAPSARATSGTMTITSDTTLTEDHYGSIEIAADDITLDCAGFSVIGPSPDPWPVDGVLVDHHSGVTIKNCVAQGFVNGFKLQGATGSILVGNTATANEGNGFYAADGSEANVFRENVSFDNVVGHGFAFEYAADHNLLSDSSAYGNDGNGVQVYRARGNEFRGDVVHDNSANGFGLDRADGSRLIDNVARGSGASGFSAFTSSNMTMRGNSAIGNYYGFSLGRADENFLANNTARGNVDNGFGLCQSSSGNVLTGNESLRNYRGFYVCRASNDNIFRLNQANRNRVAAGFGVERSDGNLFKRNRAIANVGNGFYLLFGSSYNTLTTNVACRNTRVDGYDDGTGVGNVWKANRFCTSDI